MLSSSTTSFDIPKPIRYSIQPKPSKNPWVQNIINSIQNHPLVLSHDTNFHPQPAAISEMTQSSIDSIIKNMYDSFTKRSMAVVSFTCEQLSLAIADLKLLVKKFLPEKLPLALAVLYFHIGISEYRLSNYQNAVDSFSQAYSLLPAIQDLPLTSQHCHHLPHLPINFVQNATLRAEILPTLEKLSALWSAASIKSFRAIISWHSTLALSGLDSSKTHQNNLFATIAHSNMKEPIVYLDFDRVGKSLQCNFEQKDINSIQMSQMLKILTDCIQIDSTWISAATSSSLSLKKTPPLNSITTLRDVSVSEDRFSSLSTVFYEHLYKTHQKTNNLMQTMYHSNLTPLNAYDSSLLKILDLQQVLYNLFTESQPQRIFLQSLRSCLLMAIEIFSHFPADHSHIHYLWFASTIGLFLHKKVVSSVRQFCQFLSPNFSKRKSRSHTILYNLDFVSVVSSLSSCLYALSFSEALESEQIYLVEETGKEPRQPTTQDFQQALDFEESSGKQKKKMTVSQRQKLAKLGKNQSSLSSKASNQKDSNSLNSSKDSLIPSITSQPSSQTQSTQTSSSAPVVPTLNSSQFSQSTSASIKNLPKKSESIFYSGLLSKTCHYQKQAHKACRETCLILLQLVEKAVYLEFQLQEQEQNPVFLTSQDLLGPSSSGPESTPVADTLPMSFEDDSLEVELTKDQILSWSDSNLLIHVNQLFKLYHGDPFFSKLPQCVKLDDSLISIAFWVPKQGFIHFASKLYHLSASYRPFWVNWSFVLQYIKLPVSAYIAAKIGAGDQFASKSTIRQYANLSLAILTHDSSYIHNCSENAPWFEWTSSFHSNKSLGQMPHPTALFSLYKNTSSPLLEKLDSYFAGVFSQDQCWDSLFQLVRSCKLGVDIDKVFEMYCEKTTWQPHLFAQCLAIVGEMFCQLKQYEISEYCFQMAFRLAPTEHLALENAYLAALANEKSIFKKWNMIALELNPKSESAKSNLQLVLSVKP